MKHNQLITRLNKNKARSKSKAESKKKGVKQNNPEALSTTKEKTDNQTVLVTQQKVYQPKQINIQATSTDPKAKNNQSSPKVNQSSPPKNDIIPEYEKKKKLSDQLVGLCNNVLVLTQMVNNANTQKDNLIKQYKTVIQDIQSTFKKINDENVYRTKDHIF